MFLRVWECGSWGCLCCCFFFCCGEGRGGGLRGAPGESFEVSEVDRGDNSDHRVSEKSFEESGVDRRDNSDHSGSEGWGGQNEV